MKEGVRYGFIRIDEAINEASGDLEKFIGKRNEMENSFREKFFVSSAFSINLFKRIYRAYGSEEMLMNGPTPEIDQKDIHLREFTKNLSKRKLIVLERGDMGIPIEYQFRSNGPQCLAAYDFLEQYLRDNSLLLEFTEPIRKFQNGLMCYPDLPDIEPKGVVESLRYKLKNKLNNFRGNFNGKGW